MSTLVAGCFAAHEHETPCESREAVATADVDVDVLFVIDNSPSMASEQLRLAGQVRPLVDTLIRGDSDGDGRRDFPSPRSVHLGVVTTDGGGEMVETRSGARFLVLEAADDREQFARAAAQLVLVGTAGSGNEMPLLAAARALTPAAEVLPGDVVWPAHGDTLNGGFRRRDAILLSLVITDEDDSSPGPVWRYAEAFRAAGRGGGLVLGLVGGVPRDLLTEGDGRDADAILRDPRMRGWTPEEPTYGCGTALPARRLVELAGELPRETALRSICTGDFADVLAPIVVRLSAAILDSACSGP